MPRPIPPSLSRRERQILDAIYRSGRATAAEVHTLIPNAPTPTTVRILLGVLERKGHVRHEMLGRQFVYVPTAPRKEASSSHLRHMIRTFFRGSATEAVAAVLGAIDQPISDFEYRRLKALLNRARRDCS